jgi:hypothetical protein
MPYDIIGIWDIFVDFYLTTSPSQQKTAISSPPDLEEVQVATFKYTLQESLVLKSVLSQHQRAMSSPLLESFLRQQLVGCLRIMGK